MYYIHLFNLLLDDPKYENHGLSNIIPIIMIWMCFGLAAACLVFKKQEGDNEQDDIFEEPPRRLSEADEKWYRKVSFSCCGSSPKVRSARSSSAALVDMIQWDRPSEEFCNRARSMSSLPEDKDSFDRIFRNNQKWIESKLIDDPNYFRRLSEGQQPQYMLIGCSDSRVSAQEIMGFKCGELFVHRNIANMVVNGDINLLSVLNYAVEHLKVRDIIVMGHYHCGGIKAACKPKDHGLLEHWLRNIRDVVRHNMTELEAIQDDEQRHRRLVELNVQEQCINLFANPIVQRSQARTDLPRIHGFVYDLENGRLQELEIDFSEKLKPLQAVYSLYEDNSGGTVLQRTNSKWIPNM